MNKTIHINLSGQVFTIDENAYEELSAYINDLKNIYAREVGLDDIISDIEARFAEVFSQKLEKSNRQIVSLTDVQEVIAAMGRPEEFEGDRSTQSSTYQKTYKGPKRLYRDPDDQVIAGVSSGLAAYFNIKDPVWIRIAFILLAWFGGGGLLIYIILWLVLPVAKTATQKLEMRGESVTLSNLEKSLREGIDTASSNIKNFASKSETTNALNRGVNFIGRVVGKILYILMVIIKWAFVAIVGLLLFSAVAALIGMLIATVAGMPIANLAFFETTTQATLSMIGLLLFLGIPLVILIYLPLRLFFKWKVKSNVVGLSLLAGWIVGIFLMVFAGIDIAGTLSKEYQVKNVHTMPVPDTLYLAMNNLNEPGDFENVNFGDLKYLKKKKTWVLENIELDVIENSDTSQIEVVQHNLARGKDRDVAKGYAEKIIYNVRTSGDSLLFDDVLRFGEPKKYRGQKVRLTLKVPNNTVMIFGSGLEYIVDDVPLSTYEGADNDATVYVMRNGILYPSGQLGGMSTDMEVDTKNYTEVPVMEFERLQIEGNLTVKVIHSKEHKLFVHPQMLNDIRRDNELGDLKLTRKKANITIQRDKSSNTTYDCIIYTPMLHDLSLAGNVEADVAGFSDSDLEARVSGISGLSLNGFWNDVLLSVDGKSEVKAQGKCLNLQLEMSGASEYTGRQFIAEDAVVQISGASHAAINARSNLTGTLTGVSELEYYGTPALEVDADGASNIESAE